MSRDPAESYTFLLYRDFYLGTLCYGQMESRKGMDFEIHPLSGQVWPVPMIHSKYYTYIYTQKKVRYWQQGSSHLPKIHRWAHCPQIQTVERHFSWSRWSQWSKWNPPKFSVHGAYVASGRYIHGVRDKPISSQRNPPNIHTWNYPKDDKDRNDTKIMSFESKPTKKTGSDI